jgi:hypothetical protein
MKKSTTLVNTRRVLHLITLTFLLMWIALIAHDYSRQQATDRMWTRLCLFDNKSHEGIRDKEGLKTTLADSAYGKRPAFWVDDSTSLWHQERDPHGQVIEWGMEYVSGEEQGDPQEIVIRYTVVFPPPPRGRWWNPLSMLERTTPVAFTFYTRPIRASEILHTKERVGD